MVDRIFLFTTAFGDSDAEDNVPDEDVQDNRDENHDVDGPDSMDQPSPPARVAHPQPDKPFDMVDFMHKSSSYDMQKVFDADDAALPRHVPSERPGGEARREILKGRAQNITYIISDISQS